MCNKFNKLDQSKKYSSKFLMVVLSLPISITLRICGRQMNTRSICIKVYNVLELLMTILFSAVLVLEQTDRANKIFCPMKMKITSTQLVCFKFKKICDQPTSLAHSTSSGASLSYKWRALALTLMFIAPAKIRQNLPATCKIQRKN